MIGSGAYALFLAVETSGALGGAPLERRIDIVHDVIGLVLCASLLLVSSLSFLGDRAVLRVALAAQVLLAGLISLLVPWAGFLRTAHLPALTWVVPVIILFPLLVPVRPRTTLIVSSLCALAMPTGIAALALLGQVTARFSDYLGASLAGAVAVAIAVVASRTVYGAGRQIAAARKVGSYELLHPIGRGGAGEVWEARHLLLARPAAVKRILPENLQGPTEARETALRRFTHEAQVTAELCSPYSVGLFDFGVGADGSLYYVMELLRGMNLQHFVYQFGAVEPRRGVHWLLQACHSLGEAHARGLVHRDIKPSNLFLCRYGRDVDFVKVLDFGLSKPALAPEDLNLTGPGFHVGTPGYMAPEQIFGLPIGPRTDLYALGCVAYWLLAGVTPFEDEVGGALLRQHAQAPPPLLSRKAAQAIPARLEELVMMCLAKAPEDRPSDADWLSAELRGCIQGEAWSQVEASAWWGKNLDADASARPSTVETR